MAARLFVLFQVMIAMLILVTLSHFDLVKLP